MFNKNDYAILSHIYGRKYNSPVKSIPTLELIDKIDMSSSKIRNTINEFLRAGFIAEGLKDGNNKTYYILDAGIEHFETMFKEEIKEMKNNKEGLKNDDAE
jgi:DNA-binding transcriptional regulator GbsR (MarR family)